MPEESAVGRSEVEKRPLGTYGVAISGPNYWADGEKQRLFMDSLTELIASTLEDLPGIRFLRHVAVHPDVPGTIRHWQRELGLPEIVTVAERGTVMGKALLWGTGAEDATYALVILSEGIAYALVDRSHGLGDCAESTIVHELAHVHDSWRILTEIGEVRWPMNNDWAGIRKSVASNAWSEYFAERVAVLHSGTPQRSLEWWFSPALLGTALDSMQAAIRQFRLHGNTNQLWDRATDLLSNLLNSLGRGLGAADALAVQDLRSLLDSAGLRSARWHEVAESARKELRTMYSQSNWEHDAMEGLCGVTESVFRAAGVVPTQHGSQLRIDCPW